MTEALVGLAALLVLAFLRIPIAFVMMVIGFAGMVYVTSMPGALANVGQTAFDAAINYELSVVPLFVLMGNFVARARLSEELYAASHAFLGHRAHNVNLYDRSTVHYDTHAKLQENFVRVRRICTQLCTYISCV